MFRNFLRVASRNLLKNRIFSFLNIAGLAIGMAAFLFIMSYVRFERSYENFHVNADNIYRVTLDLYNGSEYVVTDCEMYAPVGPVLKDKMPEVKDYVRMFHNDGMQDIQAGDKKFLGEDIYFADPSIFTIFSLQVLHGDSRSALVAPFQTVVSRTIALKYFGRTDAVGESVKIDNQTYQVTAVIEDLPPNTHLKFNTLLSHSTLRTIYKWYTEEDNWGGNNEYTYLLMHPGTDLTQFNEKMVQWCISMKDKIQNERILAQPIKDIHLLSHKSFEPEANGNASVVYFMLIIALAIITIAWVNYVNMATARAVERAREVGIRKVMGSARFQLVIQFLSESVIVNLVAAVLAFVLFQTGLPLFRELSGQPLTLEMVNDQYFWMLFAGLLFVGSVLSGIYPAFVLSSFQPAAVLKGKFKSSGHGKQLRSALVIAQFAATVILLVVMSAVYLQISYMRNYDIGMDLDQTLIIRAPLDTRNPETKAKFTTIKTELLRNPAIKRVARSESLPGLSLHELSTTSNVKRVGHENESGSYNYYHVGVDADFIPAMEMKLVSGHNFQDGMPNEADVIINEEAVERLGFASAEEAVGSRITFRNSAQPTSRIVGVLKNFNMQSPKEQQIPMIMYYDERATYLSLNLSTTDMPGAVEAVKKIWDKTFPSTVFHYFFLNEKYDQQFEADIRFGAITATFSGLAVFIACLGLFGLSAFTIVQRTKEIGIRKVLGASVYQIVHLLSKDFVKVVMIASLIALPAAYFAVQEWLSTYAVRIQLNAWIFLIPVALILFISLFTVSFQTVKTALENPTNSLKQE
jgi:putative ABC transport system permease protein